MKEAHKHATDFQKIRIVFDVPIALWLTLTYSREELETWNRDFENQGPNR